MPVAVSESDPAPVQPLTVNVLVALVAARLAVVIPDRPSVMPSVEVSNVLPKVKLAFLFAITVPVPAGAASDPVPVQPLTVKVLLVALSPESEATLMPLRLSVKLPLAPAPVKLAFVSV